MATGYNRIVMVGNLTRDPELKQISPGNNLCRLGLASSRQSKNRTTGATIQEVCFVDIDVWGAQADSCHQYLQKGKQVLVEGRLKLDSWTDAEGKNRSKHTIVADRVLFLGGANTGADTGADQGIGDLGDRIDDIRQRVNAVGAGYKGVSGSIESEDSEARSSRARKKTSAYDMPSEPASEINFKDEPPFKDELPF
jgi:single-strand DNA-binding protein